MIERENPSRDLRSLVVSRLGSLAETGDPWEPYRLLDSSGEPVAAVAAYFGELQAAGRSVTTQRSYGMTLLRWFRFLWAVEIAWREATRIEARDFERRKVALGDCGRAYGTSCIHEHSCVRCPLLRVDPAQRQRLINIRDNLTGRIAEAEREGWRRTPREPRRRQG